jgi:UDP-N-acetyl-2-amino-2-deoxyglucuronate dehydrogenase
MLVGGVRTREERVTGTDDAVGFAVIGAGLVGPTHAAAAGRAPGGQLVAVCDRIAERAETLAEQFGAMAFTELDAVLERRDVHIVCICLPTRLHLEVAERAVAAGKRIVVEKPLELSLERADRLLDAARARGVQVAAIFNRRFIPALKATKRAVEEGLLGDLIAADMYYKSFRTQEYYDESGWRGTWEQEGGAALINQGIHGVDLLRWVAGPVARVFGYADHRRRDIEADDTTAAVVRYANGAMGVVQAMTSITPRLPDRLEYHGVNGSIQLSGYRIARWEVPGAESWPEQVEAEERAMLESTRSLESGGHHAQIADMVQAVREGRPPAVSGEEGRRSLEVCLAIYESARVGREVQLTETGS